MSSNARIMAVAIGGSAGAVASLSLILKELPVDYRPTVFVTVHLRADSKSVLVDVLRAQCQIEVCEAEDKMPIRQGTAYIAPPNYHLLVENTGALALSTDEPVHFSRPSIDVLFESAADAYGAALVGVVLSGANRDGAHGLSAIRAAGGIVMIEDPSAAYASTMPLAAWNACPEAQVGTPGQLASFLKQL
ncbi:MAG TPA: chemotaxis protein CheB [Dyella sp.]|uniref:chemotaxis protein CheB n=1 Tax=Dyella sp. TaxID=1869338 RepID=UPI002D76DC89|nr:chemotaxis protein CheB [Dyella sp.]HET6553138.1 chemotaxis protein CheB [Dyella sp.]